MADTPNLKLRIAISQCLLGDEVRHDGGHKRDVFLTEVLAPFVDWVVVCPEVEAGLGTPREAMHLVGTLGSPRLLTIHTKVDHTAKLKTFNQKRVQELRTWDLDGYIFKSKSPSCGLYGVEVQTQNGHTTNKGTGIFSAAFQNAFPLLPIEEEEHLNDSRIRGNFFERLFCYRRWKTQVKTKRISRGVIVDFHTKHKFLLLSHSRTHYEALGKLVATAGEYKPADLANLYEKGMMEALKMKTTVKKHVNVLQHSAAHLKKYLNPIEQAELQESINDYHQQFKPLAVPLELIKHYVCTQSIPYLIDQVYLNPHPQELILHNHI